MDLQPPQVVHLQVSVSACLVTHQGNYHKQAKLKHLDLVCRAGFRHVEVPWAAFRSGAVEAYSTLEYQKIKGDKTYVEAPGQPLIVELWKPTLP